MASHSDSDSDSHHTKSLLKQTPQSTKSTPKQKLFNPFRKLKQLIANEPREPEPSSINRSDPVPTKASVINPNMDPIPAVTEPPKPTDTSLKHGSRDFGLLTPFPTLFRNPTPITTSFLVGDPPEDPKISPTTLVHKFPERNSTEACHDLQSTTAPDHEQQENLPWPLPAKQTRPRAAKMGENRP